MFASSIASLCVANAASAAELFSRRAYFCFSRAVICPRSAVSSSRSSTSPRFTQSPWRTNIPSITPSVSATAVFCSRCTAVAESICTCTRFPRVTRAVSTGTRGVMGHTNSPVHTAAVTAIIPSDSTVFRISSQPFKRISSGLFCRSIGF